MSNYLPIPCSHCGDWAVVDNGDTLKLYRPRDWDAPFRSLGLRWRPGSGIVLARNPKRAMRQAEKRARAIQQAFETTTQEDTTND